MTKDVETWKPAMGTTGAYEVSDLGRVRSHMVVGLAKTISTASLAPSGNNRGSANGNSRITEADVHLIRSRRAAGERLWAIADDYGVNDRSIANICLGRTWKHVPLRRVTPTGKLMRGRINEDGYRVVVIRLSSGRSRSIAVHRMVLEAFRGPPASGHEACHNNGIKLDNRLSNLRWDTHSENMRDLRRHLGKRVTRAKLTPESVIEMRKLRETTGLSYAKVGTAFGVTPMTAYKTCKRIFWDHVA